MIVTKYELLLKPEQECKIGQEWAYRLYASLLENASDSFGNYIHNTKVTPICQYITKYNNEILWNISIFGEWAQNELCHILESKDSYFLNRDNISLYVENINKDNIKDVEELFSRSYNSSHIHKLQICTSTAFKSQGQYRNIPTINWIIQSIIRQWNGSIVDCQIEDEDGEGIEKIVNGLICNKFNIHNKSYYIKGVKIPGFVGEMIIENRLKDNFHIQLADALLYISGYTGLGIKTGLGMGGIKHSFLEK